MSKFNSFPVPKKGKLRAVLKRPASMKTKAWKQVKYVRSPDAVPEVRMDRCKWKRSLAQILQSSPSTLVKMLREDGLLHKWEGHVCPRCCRGTLGGLQQLGGLLKHRCSAKKCHTYINPHHAHPIFVDHWGSSSTPLATQACLLMLLLNRVSHPTIHRLLHVNHKSIEDMEKRLGQLRERWVRNKEKDIKFWARWKMAGRGSR